MKRPQLSLILWMVLVLTGSPCLADGVKNVVRDCYANARIDAPSLPAEAEIFVFIDETTVLDDNLKQVAIDRATGFLGENRAFTVGRFSAFVQGHYADLVASGRIQKDFGDDLRNDLPRPKVKDFDGCRNLQIMDAKRGIGYSMLDIMNGASSSIVRSDIIASLKIFSKAVAESSANLKVMFLVSDMLENSSLANFYEKNGLGSVRDNTIKDLEKAAAFGNFTGAKVYVLGSAMIPSKDSKAVASYQDPKKLERLERFWSDWFDRSNAHLVAFGKPSLTVEIK
jgi:hypothetical protein